MIKTLLCGLLLMQTLKIPEDRLQYVQEASKYNDIDFLIILSIENHFDPNPTPNQANAVGIGQLTPIAVKEIKTVYNIDIDKENPVSNILGSYLYLQWLRKYVKNTEEAIVGYNCGLSCIGKPLPTETVNYINKYRRRLKVCQ